MKASAAPLFRCPYTGEALELEEVCREGDEILEGALTSRSGKRFPIRDGIPVLSLAEEEERSEEEERENQFYEATARDYDAIMIWMFQSFREDESIVRRRMIGLLEIDPGARALETGAGTARDSVYLAEALGSKGELHLQDLSPSMLKLGRDRMSGWVRERSSALQVEYSVANACYLPYPDGMFDAAFHFGGLNLFSDRRRAMAEMARVVRVDGKVVIGDEGVAPWLREHQHGRVLRNSNRLYDYEAPLDLLPENAQDPAVHWMIGNAYYVIEFRVGRSAPYLDLDLTIPGKRGGTHRTRYFGALEGVTLEAKEMVLKAAKAKGVSVHEWIEEVVRAATARTR